MILFYKGEQISLRFGLLVYTERTYIYVRECFGPLDQFHPVEDDSGTKFSQGSVDFEQRFIDLKSQENLTLEVIPLRTSCKLS